MIDFPNAPTLGQQFTAAGVTWTWDGAKWTGSGLSAAAPLPIGDNRIINGDMRIDQRNNGASGTAGGYTIDRWQYATSLTGKGAWQRGGAGPGVYPGGFGYCLLFTSSSAYASLTGDFFLFAQTIEADMVTDFQWGSGAAQPVTLSFWAFSSKTGTFSGSITNFTQTRSYPFSFSLPTASTWTKIVVTIPGDTAGTWLMSGNAGSTILWFDLGNGASNRGPAGTWAGTSYLGVTGAQSIVATNGAQFGLTGVKLETGSVATPFNRYSLAKSLADCQRYYQVLQFGVLGYGTTNTYIGSFASLAPAMRAAPTIVVGGSVGADNNISSVPAPDTIAPSSFRFVIQVAAVGGASATRSIAASAEL